MMHTCPTCKGSGYQTITVIDHTKENGRSSHQTKCSLCEGRKVVDQATFDIHNLEMAMWCDCPEDTILHSTYFDDGEHPNVFKHHWRCKICGKITQIG